MSALGVRDSEAIAAEQLWSDLRAALASFDKTVVRIIETRAWEPLGYASFGEAWADKMYGTRLATATAAAHVVYALIDSGLDREQALAALGASSGVGPAKFDVLARQKQNGVPPEIATTQTRRGLSLVRSHYREAPSQPRVVHVELTPTEYEHFKTVAERRGLDFGREARDAIRAHFGRLERRGGE